MTVLSVLRCGGSAIGAIGLPSSATITITPIRIISLGAGKSSNLNQLIKQNGLLSIRQFGSSGKKGGEQSGTRVAEFIKHPQFRQFKVTPSRYAWHKYKDMFHFYFMLGFIPCLAVVFLVNVFIGPPTLAIPEPGYMPKHWEHQRHPITQFMSRYIFPSYQEVYERNMFYIREEDEKRRMRLLAWKAERLMRERGDFYNYYGAKTIYPKYQRQVMEENRRVITGMGDPIDDESVVGMPLDR